MRVDLNYKKWVEEDYDVAHEEYYTTNAEYQWSKAWASSGWKHGILAIILAVLGTIFNGSVAGAYFCNIGVFTLCYLLHGILCYAHNEEDDALLLYGTLALFGLLTVGKLTPLDRTFFCIVTNALYIFFTFVHPIRHFIKYRAFKKRNIDEETGKEERENQSYQQWKSGYEQFRKGLPCGEEAPKEDPAITEARKLFEGYTDTPQQLKTRYRQLAKQYHPDKLGEGADDSMFKAVRFVYEELQEIVGKA